MSIKIALAGNPNCGKTTLFNALTGSNQFVGNWPGVTVEKKEGKLKKSYGGDAGDVVITDLPGIYSLSPYTLEEVVARNYLLGERPDAIINIVDGTNIERNLYLSTQLLELEIPVVVAVNMMDVVEKNGDTINIKSLGEKLGCEAVEISALKGTGIEETVKKAINVAHDKRIPVPMIKFSEDVESAILAVCDKLNSDMPGFEQCDSEQCDTEQYDSNQCDSDQINAVKQDGSVGGQQRFFAIKLLEKDDKISALLKQNVDVKAEIDELEEKFDDDTESIITNERYEFITSIIDSCYTKGRKESLSLSDKIDRIVTNRILALPIFAVIMFLVYYISVTTVGTIFTDWANDGVFGDGWHLFGIGTAAAEDATTEYAIENIWSDELTGVLLEAVDAKVIGAEDILSSIEEEDFGAFDENYGFYGDSLAEAGYDISEMVDEPMEELPDPAEYGIWVPGIPVLVESLLEMTGCTDGLKSLILDGIVGGVGAVLGFVPQMLVLFTMLAFLEGCGYMARVAFIMDRIFRKFGLSGKSFIPMLIGTGCGVPGVMASRTIENDRDRKMTIMTTTFIPCGAKLPIIALITAALFGGAWWVAPSAYFVGVAAIIISGIILKKTKRFAGEPAPFVMELPAYHLPTFGSVVRSMWERGWSFIKKAGTIILLSSVIIWAGSCFGNTGDGFGFDPEMELADSVLGMMGNGLKWIFAPLGFADPTATVATIMGLVAKEEVVGVFGVLDFANLGRLAGYSFLVFNLLCAPCFAAMGAIKREMNNIRWFWFAIGYQTVFAYVISLCVYQIGSIFTEGSFGIGTVAAVALIIGMFYLLFRPYKESKTFDAKAAGMKKMEAV